MTIDERLEALTETVESIAAMQRDNERLREENEKRHAWVVSTLVRLEGNVLENELQIGKLTTHVGQLTVQVGQLTATVDHLAQTVDRYITARGNGPSGQ